MCLTEASAAGAPVWSAPASSAAAIKGLKRDPRGSERCASRNLTCPGILFNQHRLHLFLLTLNFCVIVLGTIEFIWNDLEQNARSGNRKTATVAIILTTAAATYFGIEIFKWILWPADNVRPFSEFIEKAELYSLIIFGLFAVIDFFIYHDNRRSNDPKSIEDANLALESLLFIDVPVFLSVLLIMTLTKYFLSDETVAGRLTDQGSHHFKWWHDIYHPANSSDPPLGDYVTLSIKSFSVGAIAVHVLFSQVIFAILKTRMYLARAVRAGGTRKATTKIAKPGPQ